MLLASREHRSIALEADARHLFTDVWTSAGVVAGLLAVQATARRASTGDSRRWVVLLLQASDATLEKRGAPIGKGDSAVVIAAGPSLHRKPYAKRIKETGYEGAIVTTHSDGQQALDQLRATPHAFDIVLMDVQMPEMDGVSATRAIRQREAATGRARTPIIAVTANAMLHQVAAYRNAGVNAVVSKPINVATFASSVRASLPAA